MKLLTVVGDNPSWTYVSEIMDEMRKTETRFAIRHPELASQRNPLEPILVERFADLDFDISFCFRCLDKNSGWTSKARLWKNDDPNSFNARNKIPESSRTLGFDVVVYREDFQLLKNDKNAQKLLLGNELMRILKLTLPKYLKKIPMTKEDVHDMLTIIETWLIDYEWLEKESSEMTKEYSEEYILINGIEQYFLHIPNADKKEVVIMLHGGPGLPNSYIAYSQQPHLDFCNIVYYDQRGSGKTRLKNETKPEGLSLDILLEDLKQTIQYVKEKYQTDKIFLAGHSWGSLLGTQYIIKYPQDVAGYIGYGQMVCTKAQDRSWYEYLKEVVLKSGNESDIEKINSIDENFPNLKRAEFDKASALLTELEMEYGYGYKTNDFMTLYAESPIMTPVEMEHFIGSEEFNQSLYGEMFEYDITHIKEYQVPVYYVLGRYDEWTTSTIAAEYFETIKAPKKGLYWIEDAGHLVDTDNPSAFWGVIKEISSQV